MFLIGTIQPDAIVDYAILMMSRYERVRCGGKNKKEAVQIALTTSMPARFMVFDRRRYLVSKYTKQALKAAFTITAGIFMRFWRNCLMRKQKRQSRVPEALKNGRTA